MFNIFDKICCKALATLVLMLVCQCVQANKLQDYIQKSTKGMTEEEIVEWSNKTTSKLLTFSVNSKLKSLNELSLDKPIPTHCVGYARVYVYVCNYAFQVNNIKAQASQHRGPLYVFGIDVTKILSSFFSKLGMTRWKNFCKDHDYVIVKYNEKSARIDPSIYAIFGINEFK